MFDLKTKIGKSNLNIHALEISKDVLYNFLEPRGLSLSAFLEALEVSEFKLIIEKNNMDDEVLLKMDFPKSL